MYYYSGKLFWQGGPKDIIVLDIRGNSLAKLLVATSGDIETFTLVHSSLYWLPGVSPEMFSDFCCIYQNGFFYLKGRIFPHSVFPKVTSKGYFFTVVNNNNDIDLYIAQSHEIQINALYNKTMHAKLIKTF